MTGFRALLIVVVFLSPFAARAFAHGTQVIPQIFDGAGTGRTKIDITNVSPIEGISRAQIDFFHQDGTPWRIETNQGTDTGFVLQFLGPFQTIRIETAGNSTTLTVGYAVIVNSEDTTTFAEDFEVGITVFYEIVNGSNIVDTVSVPVGQRTVVCVIPVEIDQSKDLYTGLSVVDLSGSLNTVELSLFAFDANGMVPPANSGTASINLDPNTQVSKFLFDPMLFPDKTKFKGMMLCTSDGPIGILVLLQTRSSTGVQYATLTPVYQDSFRRNSSIYLRQGFPLDADLLVSDYFIQDQDAAPWDLRLVAQDAANRQLVPQSGSLLSVLGFQSIEQFDAISINTLRSLPYLDDSIGLNDGDPNLQSGFSFAIRTGLRRFVKVRISDVVIGSDGTHLALEVFVFR